MKINTGTVRLSYARLVEPRVDENGKKEYTAQLIIDKGDKWTLGKIKEAVEALKRDPKALTKWGGRANGVKSPLRDGDTDESDSVEDNRETYAGKYFVNIKSTSKPEIFDETGAEYFTDDDAARAIYSGCYVRAQLNLFAYSFNGNKGVSCWVNAIKKVRDGEPLGGGRASAEDFNDGYQEEGGDLESILS